MPIEKKHLYGKSISQINVPVARFLSWIFPSFINPCSSRLYFVNWRKSNKLKVANSVNWLLKDSAGLGERSRFGGGSIFHITPPAIPSLRWSDILSFPALCLKKRISPLLFSYLN